MEISDLLSYCKLVNMLSHVFIYVFIIIHRCKGIVSDASEPTYQKLRKLLDHTTRSISENKNLQFCTVMTIG